jgi:hypothetical protein
MPDDSSPLRAKRNASARHAPRTGRIVGGWMTRAAHNGTTTARLLPHAMRPQVWRDLWQLQLGTWRALMLQQERWCDNWKGWVHEWADIPHANTLSKLVAQQSNVAALGAQLLGEQAADLVKLYENVEVDYGYLLSRRLSQLSA